MVIALTANDETVKVVQLNWHQQPWVMNQDLPTLSLIEPLTNPKHEQVRIIETLNMCSSMNKLAIPRHQSVNYPPCHPSSLPMSLSKITFSFFITVASREQFAAVISVGSIIIR